MICPIKNKENYKNYNLISKQKTSLNFNNFRYVETHIIPIEINYSIIISPYTNKYNNYADKDLVFTTPPNKKDKLVTFKKTVKINIIEYKIDRMLSMSYYRDLMRKCSDAHKKIYNVINNITNNLLIPLDDGSGGSGGSGESDGFEDPINIWDPQRKWDEDESPIEILESWGKNPLLIKNHIDALKEKTKTIDNNEKIIIVRLPIYKVCMRRNSNSFQGILRARISNKYLQNITN